MRKDDSRLHDDADTPRDQSKVTSSGLPAAESTEGLNAQPTGAMGGLGGAALGAAAGAAAAGPIGIAIGAIAGGVGGWWAGHAIHAAREFHDHEPHVRDHHESLAAADVDYDTARPAYQLGYLASRNPDYADKSFDEIEEHVRLGWTPEIARAHGEWTQARTFVRAAYGIGRDRLKELDREVPLSAGRAGDRERADVPTTSTERAALARDTGADVAANAEEGEAVYPSEIDALANGIAAEPGSEAVREFGISDAEAARETARTTRDERTED